jgi:hypothetical protein
LCWYFYIISKVWIKIWSTDALSGHVVASLTNSDANYSIVSSPIHNFGEKQFGSNSDYFVRICDHNILLKVRGFIQFKLVGNPCITYTNSLVGSRPVHNFGEKHIGSNSDYFVWICDLNRLLQVRRFIQLKLLDIIWITNGKLRC